MEELNFWGAFDGVWPRTQMMGADVPVRALKTPKNQFSYFRTQYNQNNFGDNSCTLACSMGAISDNHWIYYSDAMGKEMYQEAVTRWLDPSVGWHLYKAVDLVVEWTNKEMKKTLRSATCKVRSNEYKASLVLGYSLPTWFSGNRKFNEDRADGVIDDRNLWKTTYWHAIRHTINNKFQVTVPDNYAGRKDNVYRNPMVEEMLKAWHHFNRAFIIYDPLDNPSKTAHRLRMIAMKKKLSDIN